METIRNGFVVYKNWAESIEALPEEYQLEVYKALAKYGLSGVMPEGLSPIAKAMMLSFAVGMEKSIARHEASKENGKAGGAPKGNKNASKKADLSTEVIHNNLKQPKNEILLDDDDDDIKKNKSREVEKSRKIEILFEKLQQDTKFWELIHKHEVDRENATVTGQMLCEVLTDGEIRHLSIDDYKNLSSKLFHYRKRTTKDPLAYLRKCYENLRQESSA